MNSTRVNSRILAAIIGAVSLGAGVVGIGTDVVSARAAGPARVHASATVTGHGITVSPTVEIVDGIIRGSFHASTTTGRSLKFTFVGSNAGGKMDIGNVPVNATSNDPQSFTVLPYANWLDGGAKGVQSFTVRVSHVPGRGLTAAAALKNSVKVTIPVNVSTLAPGNTPVAFTYKVTSFDGTVISTNFFPASGLSAGSTANTLLGTPDLGVAGETNPYATHGTPAFVPGPAALRAATAVGDVAYDLVTYDPRGTGSSGGTSQLGSVFHEGRDVSALIDWIASTTSATLNGSGDPAIGLFGNGLGGSVTLMAGSSEPRIDAVVPMTAPNTFDSALHQNGIYRGSAGAAILATVKSSGSRINSTIASGLARAAKTGKLSDAVRAALAGAGAGQLLRQSQAPAFFIQGSSDPVNRLDETTSSMEAILANPYGTPVKAAWIDARNASDSASSTLVTYSKAWFNKYVSGVPIPDAFTPNLQWWDQSGTRQTSSLHPFSAGFNNATPVTGTSTGGLLRVNAPAGGRAVSVITAPINLSVGDTVVGAPSVSFTYSGKGTRRAVFARIVDKSTGRVVGPLTTPVPVTLDGAQHTVSVPMSTIVWTVATSAQSRLELQILPSSKSYPHRGSGPIAISNVRVDVPTMM